VSSEKYSAAFGSQWKKYRLTQLDSHTGVPISRNRLARCMGDWLWSDLSDKEVLEAGCGAGRFTEILLEKGALVTSIDLSEAVEANQENCPQSERHRIAQADITSLPFKPKQFDVVLCLGVIQHTPDPETTIAALYNQVKPGGHLVIDHYTYDVFYYVRTLPYLRMLFRRLPAERGLVWSEHLVNGLLPAHKHMQQARVLHFLLSRISPVLCYYREYPELSAELQHEWALLDTHDALTDWYKHFRTREQTEKKLTGLGASEIACSYGGIGVEARARRPVTVRMEVAA
jgi:SAM-dependent methyltransferase